MKSLLEASIDDARRRKVIAAQTPIVACDATGYESHHVSAYFARRSGQIMHDFPKISELIEIKSHLALATQPGRGPSPDCPALPQLIERAKTRARFAMLLADAGYDGQPQHDLLAQHDIFGIIPPRPGRPARNGKVGGATRAMLHRHWETLRPIYAQRWQCETRYAMSKQHLGSALRSRHDTYQQRECQLRSITLNFMLEPSDG